MSMINKAVEDMEEWNRRTDMDQREQPHLPMVRTEAKWEPPPPNWFNYNVDGAWDESKDQCGIGWVSRNHQGEVFWMELRKLPKLRTPIEVEAEALRWAMRTMLRLNFRNVIFVSDSESLVEALREEPLRPSLHTYLQDITHMSKRVTSSKVIFQGREANRVADRIAKEAISLEISAPKLYTVMPIWLKFYLENDFVCV
ncbi:PREDICTED: uncharacterized protein LOC106314409 [Brassica oleracea var. oleracea]|uniref:uncharacterized protein LOC106314409 n=1 Tax=Brassica oleracea var. oleracea TaxID=109376 RepID=UPI0006A7579D|nr:PREDICTED: uncharacterized protein LOC106314409 [Brassica oleracea var. oleracea]